MGTSERFEKRHKVLPPCFFVLLRLSTVLLVSPEAHAQSVRVVPENTAQVQLSFAPVVAQVVPSVVNVYARRVVQRRRGLFDDPFFQQFFGDDFAAPRRRTQQSLGSGVIVDSAGLIVTNHHVIDGAQELTVVLSDRREFKAELVLDDARTDLAVLKLQNPPSGLPALAFRDSDDIRVGDLVLAVGNPFGVGQTVTNGIVSALARSQVGVADYQSFIQTDAAINPGNSGGALVTLDGRLLGVNTAIFSKSGGSVGIGFAIPANLARPIIQQLQKYGKARRGWLGVRIQTVTDEIAQSLGLEKATGALVASLTQGGPAEKHKIKVGDVILKFDNKVVGEMRRLPRIVAETSIGKAVSVEVWRNGKRVRLPVTLGEFPEDDAKLTAAMS